MTQALRVVELLTWHAFCHYPCRINACCFLFSSGKKRVSIVTGCQLFSFSDTLIAGAWTCIHVMTLLHPCADSYSPCKGTRPIVRFNKNDKILRLLDDFIALHWLIFRIQAACLWWGSLAAPQHTGCWGFYLASVATKDRSYGKGKWNMWSVKCSRDHVSDFLRRIFCTRYTSCIEFPKSYYVLWAPSNTQDALRKCKAGCSGVLFKMLCFAFSIIYTLFVLLFLSPWRLKQEKNHPKKTKTKQK